jgi:hypothetical protein
VNSTQRSILEQVFLLGLREPTDSSLPQTLEAELNGSLSGLDLTGMRLTKQHLGAAEQCAGKLAASLRGEVLWEMTPEMAAGQLLHRAAEVEAGTRTAVPAVDVVDHAVRRFKTDEFRRGFAKYWAQLDEATRAEIRARATSALDALRATLPALSHLRDLGLPTIPEVSMFVSLASGLELVGRVDLTLGTVATGLRTRVLIDLKTGGGSAGYREDMRFYALLHLLRFGVEPSRVVTLFVPSGTWQDEAVDADVLRRAVNRVALTARLAVDALAGEEHLVPGPYCRYCPRRVTCPVSAWKRGKA